MNQKQFDKVLDRRIELIKEVLSSKGAEYSTGKDKCHNFRRAGEMLRTTPEKALVGMWSKHLISIFDIVDKIENENLKIGLNFILNPLKVKISKALIEEKIGDAINYLILLEALLKERYE